MKAAKWHHAALIRPVTWPWSCGGKGFLKVLKDYVFGFKNLTNATVIKLQMHVEQKTFCLQICLAKALSHHRKIHDNEFYKDNTDRSANSNSHLLWTPLLHSDCPPVLSDNIMTLRQTCFNHPNWISVLVVPLTSSHAETEQFPAILALMWQHATSIPSEIFPNAAMWGLGIISLCAALVCGIYSGTSERENHSNLLPNCIGNVTE